MNADGVQAEQEGLKTKQIKNATPQSAKTISPIASLEGGIGNEEEEEIHCYQQI